VSCTEPTCSPPLFRSDFQLPFLSTPLVLARTTSRPPQTTFSTRTSALLTMSDRSSSPPLELDPSTLAALQGFLAERDEAEEQFKALEEKAHQRLVAAQAEDGAEKEKMISPAEFRKIFAEDWQMSQFWYALVLLLSTVHVCRPVFVVSTSSHTLFRRYSDDFAARFSSFVHSFSTPTTRIAFLSCPTSYVAFQHHNPRDDVWLFEYDKRFELFAADKFVHYDLEEPLKFPEELRGTVDIAIADPPFLNEVRCTSPISHSLFYFLF
jgi:hypothetical protein